MESRLLCQYKAPWTIYALHWSTQPQFPWRIAVGSFIEEYRNRLQIVSVVDQQKPQLVPIAEQEHAYPITKIMWQPGQLAASSNDLLATTGDFLRIWQIPQQQGQCKLQKSVMLTNNKGTEYCAPLTSFDWNESNPNIIGSSSIDTTCTIWDIETQQSRTQLIAHDKEVYDIGFTPGSTEVFASVGGDGSVRMFDLRNLEHSTIVYETPDSTPLLRLAWNKQDPNYLATFQMDSSKVVVLDVRVPSVPVTELHGHSGPLNSIAWAPHSSAHICTAGQDSQVLVWDLSQMRKYIQDPILCYESPMETNSISWSRLQPDWVAIAYGDTLEALRI